MYHGIFSIIINLKKMNTSLKTPAIFQDQKDIWIFLSTVLPIKLSRPD